MSSYDGWQITINGWPKCGHCDRIKHATAIAPSAVVGVSPCWQRQAFSQDVVQGHATSAETDGSVGQAIIHVSYARADGSAKEGLRKTAFALGGGLSFSQRMKPRTNIITHVISVS